MINYWGIRDLYRWNRNIIGRRFKFFRETVPLFKFFNEDGYLHDEIQRHVKHPEIPEPFWFGDVE